MPRDVRVYLHDILRACDEVLTFVEGKTFEEYAGSSLLRSAVERQLAIVGEALNQALKLEPNLIEKVSVARQIVDFRNLLIHAYMNVSAPIVWSIVKRDLSLLRQEVRTLLG